MNNIFIALYNKIANQREDFSVLLNADRIDSVNININDILDFLEFSNDVKNLNGDINNHIIITEGDIMSILRIVHDLANEKGIYILFINDENKAVITYLINSANDLYKKMNIEVEIKIDYSRNYNYYLNDDVTIIGSDEFVNTAKDDFTNYEIIIV
jgi:hypothetical protein